ncbi:MAG: DNA polymerase III subunit alpha [Treponema sp.]|jgi:DNA polymerase-3 subunit alpha|nr:DNA polymerase III subunit alpha [Treponema sp.]
MTEFVHLHVHSDYSLADASVSIKSLVTRAEELGMTHLALTDHGNMFGAMEFIEACKKTVVENADGNETEKKIFRVNPIIGCEVYVSPGSRFDKKGAEHENRYYHLILLAANRKGYFNLVKLCSLAYTEGFYFRPRIDEEILSLYHGGLIALSACASGEIPRLIQAGKIDDAQSKALYYRDLFGYDENGEPCFYLEIQDHGIPSGGLRGSDLSQKDINEAVAGISARTGIPLAATNDVHYLNREDYTAHDILLCIGTGKVRSEEKRKRYYGDQFYFKTGDEMAQLFGGYPQAIENTARIARRCKTDVPGISVKELPRYLPDFRIPESFKSASSGEAARADEYLRHLAEEGLAERYEKELNTNRREEIRKRAEYELDTIISMGFTGYFLIVWDFIKYARERGIPVGPGRGSGAGSIVAYALHITDIEPLKYNLLFERFLNPERISMPDFDIDFANNGREEVINYVTGKYGKERVGQIITFGTLGAKAVLKDVARTLGIPFAESISITKLVPKGQQGQDITLKSAFENEPKLLELEKDPRYAELFELARKLEGLNRNSSLHAAGVVIGKYPLIDLVPLYQERDDARTGRSGAISTQYSMNYLEPCGLVKMDFLGLKTLDVIKNTEELIRLRQGEYSSFCVKDMKEDDEATFKMLGEGKSFEVFQFESEGMQNILKQTKPGSIEDLTALNAMYRPGPMQNIPRFVDSKNGKQPITYPDKSLEGILKETYGVIVYQEQVMEVAKIIAGYSMGKADLLRRAMGKKKKEILEKEKIPFLEGAAKQGFPESKAGFIYDMLVPFAGYGFNKSHAAAYSVIAYHTAYLKANFPAEFMAANLTNEINSADNEKLSKCIDEARKMGLSVEPPCVNKSGKHFTVVNGKIIYGLLGIKGVGEASADEIVRGRQEEPYKSFTDFLDKIDIKITGKKVIELLVQTGAFDSFGITRETLAGNLERLAEYALKKKEDEEFGQSNLFEDPSDLKIPEFKYEEFKPAGREERLNLEKKLLGFYFSGHPMDEYREIWNKTVNVNLGKLEKIITGNCILVGIIKTLKIINTSKGGKMAFASLQDYNGEIEVTFFSAAWEKCGNFLEVDKVAILRGKIDYQKDKEKYSFIAEDFINRQNIDSAIRETEENNQKIQMHRNTWLYMADLKSSNIANMDKGNYTVIGYLKTLREFKDKNENEMAFAVMQDFEGEIDLVFFSRIYAECRHLLKLDEIMALKGSIDPQGDRNPLKPAFRVSSIADYPYLSRSASRKAAAGEEPAARAPEKQPEKKAREIHIRLKETAAENDENLLPLRDYFAHNSGGCQLYLHVPLTDGGTKEKVILAGAGIGFLQNDDIDIIKKFECVADAWRV